MLAAAGRSAPVLPVVALMALLALPVSGDTARSGGAAPADAMSGVLVLLAVAGAVRRAERPLSRTALVVLGLPVVGFAVAATGAADAATGLTGLGRYLQVFVLVPAAVLLLVRDRADLRVLAWAFVGLALVQGGIGAHQYATGTGASYMGADIRAVGTFGPTDVMGMATVVSYGVICAVGLALGAAPGTGTGTGTPAGSTTGTGTGTGTAVRQRAVALVCALLLLVPLALSFSRGAWIATAVACAAQLLLAGVRRAVAVGAVLAAVLVVLVGGVGVGTAMLQERVDSITKVTDAPDQSVLDRYTMWAAAVGMWRERPVTGVGLKNFPAHRDGHASLALSSGSDTAGAGSGFVRQPLLSPHNMYLLVLSEQGLLGLLALAGGWGALLVLGVRRLALVRRAAVRAPGGPSARGADCGLLACGLLVWQLVDFAYADIGGPSTVLTAVALGVVAWWALGADAR
ncbi:MULTISPECIES: O-antigen ligase family protein [unclassified Streptomyces]|uniref:O-antigen ligase family protein n=1 Tax=unclassified Streptomyces TaxID=2593676 RepID=UPI001F282F8E|nr:MULTISPECIES: O-antigen ligase family protein [unclassified Streptomyces]